MCKTTSHGHQSGQWVVLKLDNCEGFWTSLVSLQQWLFLPMWTSNMQVWAAWATLIKFAWVAIFAPHQYERFQTLKMSTIVAFATAHLQLVEIHLNCSVYKPENQPFFSIWFIHIFTVTWFLRTCNTVLYVVEFIENCAWKMSRWDLEKTDVSLLLSNQRE